MKRIFKIGLLATVALILQSCAGVDRVKVVKALDANNIAQFQAEVRRIQTDPSYDSESRAEGLYDALLLSAGRNKEATLYLLDQGVPIDYPSGQPQSSKRGLVLLSAVERYQPEIVSLLLARGANPNIELWAPNPADNILYLSLMHSDLVITRILLEGGANPNQWRNPFYPSIIAQHSGHPQIVQILKEYGGVSDPTPEQRAGSTVKMTSNHKAASKPTPIKSTTNKQTVMERLEKILNLKEQGIISQDEYSKARAKILAEL